MIDRKTSLSDSQSAAMPPQPEQMADASADRLMNDLFDGVERALEGDVEALEVPQQPDIAETPAASELTLSFTEGGLPAVLLDHAAEETLTQWSPGASTETATPTSTPQNWRRFWTMNRALLGAAGLSIMATIGLWVHQRQQVPLAATAPAASPVEVPTVGSEVEFLEYLRRSLEVIAQNAPAAPTATTSVPDVTVALNSGNAAGLPPIGSNALPSPSPAGVPSTPGAVNVIERVYVPYPSTAAAVGTPTSGVATGTPTTGSGAVAAVAANSHKLLGVLELGDRSAALFEIEEVPQRVYIGERIANSGWSLVSVANEEAVVRRNGEVRTLYIGQQF